VALHAGGWVERQAAEEKWRKHFAAPGLAQQTCRAQLVNLRGLASMEALDPHFSPQLPTTITKPHENVEACAVVS
jgi:hypothetical protein